MLARIAAFEIRFQLRSPLFWISAAIFFLLAFAATTINEVQIGDRGNVHVNSPFALLQTVGIMNPLGIFVIAAFAAGAVLRDEESGFAPILRSTPLAPSDYLLGRFAGAALVAFMVLSFAAAGVLVGSWMPWLDPERVGPNRVVYYAWTLLLYSGPTIFVMSGGLFSLATLTRSMRATLIGALASVMALLLTLGLLRDPRYDAVTALIDPFGIGALRLATKYWTITERNQNLPALAGPLLQNRALWLTVALALLAILVRTFRFEAPAGRSRPDAVPPEAGTKATESAPSGPIVAERGTAWRQLLALARFDLAYVLRGPGFAVLLALGCANALAGLWLWTPLPGVAGFPVTRALVTVLQGSFTIFAWMSAIFYAGELAWRDREKRMHEMIDATPAPDWAHLLPKVLAIVVALAAVQAVSVLAAVAVQAMHGYSHFEIGHYLTWYFLPNLWTVVLVAVLAVFVQAIVPSKQLGWAVMLLFVVASIGLFSAGFEHSLYNYASSPDDPLSDMNGSGRFADSQWWVLGYWSACALLLAVLAFAMWPRGIERRLAPRVLRLRSRLAGPVGAVAALALCGWVGLGFWTYYNTNVLNRYWTAPGLDRWTADYERTLLPYESVPQPTIADVQLDVDLYPREVRVLTQGRYTIENRTGAALDTVHVRWHRRLTMEELQVDGARPERDFGDFHYRIYRFESPLKPGERAVIRFRTTLQERGFPNSRPLTRVVENGTFVDNTWIAPGLGIDRSDLLRDRSKRRKYGLAPDLRPPALEDEAARAHNILRRDSDWVTAQIRLTTDADQVPVAPGTTVSDETVDGRRTVRTRTDAPILNIFSMQSARYEVRRDTLPRPDGRQIALAVYYHPAHPYNVEAMLAAMRASIELYETEFSPFQFGQARILEFPAYETFAESFAGTVPYSEAIGFIVRRDDPEKFDLVTYVTAHEIAHQWWAHQLIGADKQGSEMLAESFAQYSALLVQEKLLGRDQVRRFLKYELDRYLRSRGGEVVEELPLARVEEQPYIYYQKGTLAMYWLKEAVGQDVVDRALRRMLQAYAFKPAPYPDARDFLRILREEAGPQHDALITDLFERITLYDVAVRQAQAARRPDGRFDVTLTVEAHKLYADGQGKETEAPLDEPFEIGVFDAEPGRAEFGPKSVLFFERRPLHSGQQAITVTVDREPKFAGADPYNKRIDRNSDDNVHAVDLR
jgi:ABC-2 type transport system permease protein